MKSFKRFLAEEKEFLLPLLLAVIKYAESSTEADKAKIIQLSIPPRYKEYSGIAYRGIYLNSKKANDKKEIEKFKMGKGIDVPKQFQESVQSYSTLHDYVRYKTENEFEGGGIMYKINLNPSNIVIVFNKLIDDLTRPLTDEIIEAISEGRFNSNKKLEVEYLLDDIIRGRHEILAKIPLKTISHEMIVFNSL